MNEFTPDISKLQRELGRSPALPETHPTDYAPKRAPAIAQPIKVIMRGSPRWAQLSEAEREALELIATSISYILTATGPVGTRWADIEEEAKGVA